MFNRNTSLVERVTALETAVDDLQDRPVAEGGSDDATMAHIKFVLEKYFGNEKPPVALKPKAPNAPPEMEPMIGPDGKQVYDPVSGNPVYREKKAA